MEQAKIRTIVEKFFTIRNCEIVKSNHDELQVVLNPETDKDLEYRPFYWSYVENLKIQPQLLMKRYIFNQNIPQENYSDEYLFFGSRRLHQIFQTIRKRGKYVRLYEDKLTDQRVKPLQPWLMVNYKVEYVCDTKKEAVHSLGFNLISGKIIDEFYNRIRSLPLTPKLPHYMFTPTPLFSIQSGFKRLEEKIREFINAEDATWAEEARKKFEQEAKIVRSYYDKLTKNKRKKQEIGEVPIEDECEQRLKELEWQYLPRINVIPLSIALVYLYTQPQ